jgi:hypothetical protein
MIVNSESPENRSAEREISPVLRNLAGGNPLQPETQTFIPNYFKRIGSKPARRQTSSPGVTKPGRREHFFASRKQDPKAKFF